MKNTWLCSVIIALLFAACTGKADKGKNEKKDTTKPVAVISVNENSIVDTVLLNQIDTAFVVKPKPINDDIGDKRKEYIINVYFSGNKYPTLTHKNAIGADLFLADDLDKDGKPELLLRPDWFSSCWASINLYSVKSGNWKLIKQGSMYFCSDEYPLSKRIIKTAKGYGLLTDSLTDDKFITLKKEIKF